MANITINELQPAEFAELSDLQLEAIVGGYAKGNYFQDHNQRIKPKPRKPRYPFN
jgi:hypothetical protein